jgi:hypothetical protein
LLEALNYSGLVTANAQDEAVCCVRHFEPVRDSLFYSYPWVFARNHARLTTTVATVLGWQHAYVLPANCLKVLQIVLPLRTTPMYEQLGTVLACDYENPGVRYTSLIPDPDDWDALFSDAFCARLAQEIALSVSGEPAMAEYAFQKFQFAISEGYRTGAIDPGMALDNKLAAATFNTTRMMSPTPQIPGVSGMSGTAAENER